MAIASTKEVTRCVTRTLTSAIILQIPEVKLKLIKIKRPVRKLAKYNLRGTIRSWLEL